MTSRKQRSVRDGSRAILHAACRASLTETLETRLAMSVTPFVTETGFLSTSISGAGYTTDSGTLQVNKPAGATVKSAYLLAASTGETAAKIAAGDVTFDGSSITFAHSQASDIDSNNYYTDVTSLVSSKINAAPTGTVNFPVSEKDSFDIDGEILAVIFNDPTQKTINTEVLLFGAQNPTGDSFNIGFANPINTSVNKTLDLSLGISYSYQANASQQFSTLKADGTLISSAAGGEDDGASANGALITVGGIGDSDANPADPTAKPTTARSDDELYNLASTVKNGDTKLTVATDNPSDNDNIFFAAFSLSNTTAVVGEGVTLVPANQTADVGATAPLTAKVQDNNGNAITGRAVTFKVTAGPDKGDTKTVNTNGSGQAVFDLTGATAGTDTVTASFVDSSGKTETSNTATVVFKGATAPVATITVTPPADQTATAGVAKTLNLGSFAQTNATGPYTVTVNWGDGSKTTFADAAAGTIPAHTHTYAKAGTDTVSVTVVDSASHTSNTAKFHVTVSAVTPTPTPTATGTIAGTVYRDLTGNGLTSDDTGLGAVTVTLYVDKDGNGVLDKGDTTAHVTSTQSDGDYSFTSLPAGKYVVVETTPAGYVRTAPLLTDDYGVTLTATTASVTGDDYADFLKPTSSGVSDLMYHVNGKGYSTLRGHTFNGATISATFTVTDPAGSEFTLVSYTADTAKFSEAAAHDQTVFQKATNFFKPGTYTLTIKAPSTGHFQVDFVEGHTLTQFGPAGSNLFYTNEGRLISADNE